MTDADALRAPPRSRSLWWIAAPTLLVLALAAGWSVFWYVAAHRADEAIDLWLSREAAKGRVYACADRRFSGYPFRAELTCESPSAKLPSETGTYQLTAARFVAVAQIYDPSRMIGELTGPVKITAPDGREGALSFALAQASMGLSGKRFERVSIAIDAFRATMGPDELLSAKEVQVHMRRAPDQPDGVYDAAVRVDDAVSPALDLVAVGNGPLSADVRVQAIGGGVDDLRPLSLEERLRAFAEQQGRLHVALARVARGDVAVEARGDLALDNQGRVEGAGDVVARGVDGMIQGLLATGKKSEIAAMLGIGAQLLGAKTELDGAPATSYRMTIDKGKVAIGPIKIYKLPPAF